MPEVISKKEARALGLKWYFTGIPCKFGHIAERATNGSACRDCYARRNLKCKEYRAERYKRNAETVKAQMKEYYVENRERTIANACLYSKRNRTKINERRKAKYRSDLNYKLSMTLRWSLNGVLRKGGKAGSAVRDLGCSIDEFKHFIESQFTAGMSWQSWGKNWHLDHIKPVGLYTLSNRAHYLEVAHYTNYQPLSIEDHKRKTAEDVRKICLAKKESNNGHQNRQAV